MKKYIYRYAVRVRTEDDDAPFWTEVYQWDEDALFSIKEVTQTTELYEIRATTDIERQLRAHPRVLSCNKSRIG